MRLDILSDLHLQLASFEPDAVAVEQADLVVLAGDIHKGVNGISWARRTFPDKPVIYVAGNHEFYDQYWSHLADKLREESRHHDAYSGVTDRLIRKFLTTCLRTSGYKPQEVWRLEERANDCFRARSSHWRVTGIRQPIWPPDTDFKSYKFHFSDSSSRSADPAGIRATSWKLIYVYESGSSPLSALKKVFGISGESRPDSSGKKIYRNITAKAHSVASLATQVVPRSAIARHTERHHKIQSHLPQVDAVLIPQLFTAVNHVQDASYDQSDLKRGNENSRLRQQSQK